MCQFLKPLLGKIMSLKSIIQYGDDAGKAHVSELWYLFSSLILTVPPTDENSFIWFSWPASSRNLVKFIFAARRSYSFYSGICHRIRVGRKGRRAETLLEPAK